MKRAFVLWSGMDSKPIAAMQGSLGRSALRGFGATQVDLTLRKQFKVYERFSL